MIHQVLHYAEEPEAVISEAARVLRPGGRLIVVDFLSHDLESLREQHAHRRLGFAKDEVSIWAQAEGLAPQAPILLQGDPLTVGIWTAAKQAAAA